MVSGKNDTIEAYLQKCFDLEDDAKIESYIESLVVNDDVKSKLREQMGFSDRDDVSSIVSTFSGELGKTFTKKHPGIFQHYIQTLDQNPNYTEDSVKKIRASIESTRRRMELRKPRDRTNCYGLVVGRIQSGKTAHLIGTALHAIDSEQTNNPFDTVIVLSGLIDDLRTQTRSRFEKITESYDLGERVEIIPGNETDLNSGNKEDNNLLRRHFSIHQKSSKIIVIKKNHKILENLLHIIEQKGHHSKKKYLIIDDEADHASMDTNASGYENIDDTLDEDPTRTNRLLRQIMLELKASHQVWYIGYTATPYANLLMMENNSQEDQEFGLPLFPRDFLHALPKPTGHLDNEYYFGSSDGLKHVNTRLPPIPDSREEGDIVEEMFFRHLLTQIMKKLDGLDIHHTTLVHTDILTTEHLRYARKFIEFINYLKENKDSVFLSKNLRSYLSEYQIKSDLKLKVEAYLDNCENDWNIIAREIRRIEVVEVNRREASKNLEIPQDLKYNIGPNKRSYIAVGGTRLSRGLTLEGLTNTWFTRTAQTPVYDTMLQMARWCGYRKDYDNLVRIFTTSEICEYYQHITFVEKDIRTQIESRPENSDPLEDVVWIKEHSNMNVTAKMPAEYDRRDWGDLNSPVIWTYETPYFQDGINQKANQIFVKFQSLIGRLGGSEGINTPPLNQKGSFLLKLNIEGRRLKPLLATYVESYGDHDKSRTKLELEKVIRKWDNSQAWNLAIHTPSLKHVKSSVKVRGMEIGLVQRTTSELSENRFSIIQSSNDDIYSDIEPGGMRTNPLLIIYLINPDSEKAGNSKARVFPSDINCPVLGLGIVFSNSTIGDGGTEISRKKEE